MLGHKHNTLFGFTFGGLTATRSSYPGSFFYTTPIITRLWWLIDIVQVGGTPPLSRSLEWITNFMRNIGSGKHFQEWNVWISGSDWMETCSLFTNTKTFDHKYFLSLLTWSRYVWTLSIKLWLHYQNVDLKWIAYFQTNCRIDAQQHATATDVGVQNSPWNRTFSLPRCLCK